MDFRKRIQTIWTSAALIGFIALTPSSHAQQVVAPLSTPTAIAEQQAASTSSTTATPAVVPSPVATSNGLRWGPINFRPHFSYRYLYGNGIQASAGNAKRTEIHNISPGLFAELGRHWTIDYTPTWTYYSSSAFRDSVNEAGQINWSTKFEEWTLSAAQTYSRTDSPLIETATQTQQTNYASTFNALYALNSRYALETTLGQSLNFAEGFTDTRTWSAQETLHRQISSRLNTGLGMAYSYTAIDRTPDVATLRFLGNASWRPVTQLNVSLQAGIEKTRVYNKAASTKQNPTYSATVLFIPVTTTQLGVTASRSTSASFLSSQLTETTRYGFTLSQRLLQRLQFSAELSQQKVGYSSTRPTTEVDRNDRINLLNLSLNTTFLDRMRAGVTYQKSHNTSNSEGLGFSSEQSGIEISYSF